MISLGSREASFGRRARFVPCVAQIQGREDGREHAAAASCAARADGADEEDAPSAETAQAAALLDLLPNATVLIDRRLRIVGANRAADALLAESDGLVTIRKNNQPHLAAPADNRRLEAILASAVSAAEAGEHRDPSILRVSRASDHRTLIFVVTPLPPGRFPLWAGAGYDVRAMVQVVDPHATLATQVKVLQQAFGLTAAESRVLTLVAEGLTRSEAAKALNLSPTTVCSYLASCFDKTGARSQVALVRMVASVTGSSPKF